MTLRDGLARAAGRLRGLGGSAPAVPAAAAAGDAGPRVRITGPQGRGCVIDVAPPGPDATVNVTFAGVRALDDVQVSVGRIERGTVTVHVAAGHVRVRIGASPVLNARLDLGTRAEVEIGAGTTAGQLFVNCARGSVRVGRDCMASRDVMLMAAVHHGMVDLSTGSPQPLDERPEIVVGDHVWLGFRSTVVGGSRIGDGSVLGAGAVAAGRYEPASTIAGNPARVIRRHVSWCRNADAMDPGFLGFLAEHPELLGGSAEPLPQIDHQPLRTVQT